MKRKNQTIFKTEKKHRQSLNYTPLNNNLIERIPRRLRRWSRGKFENLWFSSN